MKNFIDPRFLSYVLGVLTATAFSLTGLLIEKKKLVKRMSRNEAFLNEMGYLVAEMETVAKDDTERQKKISEAVIKLMNDYDM